MDRLQLCAWWASRQGLDGGMRGQSASAILERAGWARSVGGAGPYLTLFARGGLSRQSVDNAVAGLEIHELPSARGCTYVLPARDFALGLKLGQPFRAAEMSVANKLGVTEKEIDRLSIAIKKSLSGGALNPEEIREAVGSSARNLGEEGKKKGLSTTLPLALSALQSEGRIRRVPVNGRLDQQRYRYVLWSPPPVAEDKSSYEECCTELARRYFSWTGPARVSEFQWFSGLNQKAAKAAISRLKLVPAGEGSDRLMPESEFEEFQNFKRPKQPVYKLVSSIDGMSLLRRDLKSLLDEAHADLSVPVEKDRKTIGSLTDLPSHAILDRGRLVGLWEFDPARSEIVWISFVKPDAALKKAVADTGNWIQAELGDARGFSLDSPKSREPKLAALRAMANR